MTDTVTVDVAVRGRDHYKYFRRPVGQPDALPDMYQMHYNIIILSHQDITYNIHYVAHNFQPQHTMQS
jgi:hypothetical protein